MRQQWLDIFKGIGISAVVVGHVMTWRYVYSFHMPLFFLVSGYTFHVRENELEWFWTCCRRYLLPYFSFLVLLNVCTLLLYGNRLSMYKFLYGGCELMGIYGTFWFITVLFLALIILNAVIKRRVNVLFVIVFCLLLSYFFYYNGVSVRWNAQVVPFALVYMLIGYTYKNHIDEIDHLLTKNGYKYILYFFVACASIVPVFILQVRMDMKQTDFGIPILSLVVSLLICFGLMRLSKWLEFRRNIVNGVLIYIGKASLVIMFLHQFFREILWDLGIEKRPIRLVLAISIPTLIYYLFEKIRITRTCFLGK